MMTSAKWLASLVALAIAGAAVGAESLPSWNDGPAKQGITFVNAVTQKGGKDFVQASERIAVFDNDGTLWIEQPIYVQAVFMLDQLRAAAPKHPEWKSNAAFNALMAQDKKALAEIGQKPILELLAVANSGMSVGEYDQSIRAWLKSARHPQLERPYTQLIDDDITARAVDFIKRQSQAGKPFFVWINTTHMHLRTHTKPESLGQAGQWQGFYHDAMIDHDKNVGTVLKALDDLGIANDTFLFYSTDNGPHIPQRQKPASFNLDEVMRSMSEGPGSK